MKKTLFAALALTTAALPATAVAQSIPQARIAVVDVETAIRTCTACATAFAQLQQQAQQIDTREQQLLTPLQTEGQAINAEIQALNGADPSDALNQRYQAFEQRRVAAAQEIQQRRQTLQRNQNYVLQQIGAQLDPAYATVLASRQVNLIVPANSTLAHQPAIDVTNDVVARLNQTLTTVNTVAPAPQQPAQQPTTQPQGR